MYKKALFIICKQGFLCILLLLLVKELSIILMAMYYFEYISLNFSKYKF
jgi:hypothetical protein